MARAAVIPPTSPPKKTGRGRPRTKAPATETDAATKVKSKTTKGKTLVPTTEPKRRVGRPPSKKVEVELDEGTDDEIGTIETKEKSKVPESRGKESTSTSTTFAGPGRGRKVAAPTPVDSGSDDEDELAQSDVPKRRVGRPRTKPVSREEADAEPDPAAPRGRGRPRTVKPVKGSVAGEDEKGTGRKKGQVKGSSGLTRNPGPKAIYITTNSTAARSNLLRGPAKKKTVSFKDVSGSEAEGEEEGVLPAQPTVGGRRRTGAREGMRAKPVRKPATGTGRGRKHAAAKDGVSKPLSPKKANQVTKTLSSYISSDGEEDELSGEKQQIKLVVRSPIRPGPEHTGLTSPVRKVNFTPNKPKTFDENGELTLQPTRSIDFSDSVYMSSPARRPTASPFQFTMKETAKRGGRGLWEGAKSLAQPNLSPIQDSPLRASPKKGLAVNGILGTPFLPVSQPDFGVSSPLKVSPKKGGLGASFSQSAGTAPTPFAARASLIQSPAKKIASPFKSLMTPKKAPVAEPAGIDAGSERSVSVTSSSITSPSLVKAGSPQEIDSNVGSEVNQEISPAVSEDEAQLTAEDAVEMVEEPNACLEQTDQENHQVGEDEDWMEDPMEGTNNAANECDGQLDENMDGLTDEVEGKGHHTEYDAYDCTYLQEEVQNCVEECQRQLDCYSQAGKTNWVDDKHAGSESDAVVQPEAEINEDGDLNIMSDVESRPQTPLRLSIPAGLEDVFVDNPGDHKVANTALMKDNGEFPEEVDEDNSEGQATHSEVEGDGQVTPMAFDKRERLSAVSGSISPCVLQSVEHIDENTLKEPVDPQAGGQHMEEEEENTHMTFDNPEPNAEDPVLASPYEIYEGEGILTPSHIPPPAPTPPVDNTIRNYGNVFRDTARYSMASNDTTILESADSRSLGSPARSTPFKRKSLGTRRSLFKNSLGFTPLANRFSQWKPSSPGTAQQEDRRRRGVFSLGGMKAPSDDIAHSTGEVSYSDISEHPLADSGSSSPELPPQTESDIGSAIYEDQGQEPEMLEEDAPQSVGSERQPMGEIISSPEYDITAIDDEEASADQSTLALNPAGSPAPSAHSVHAEQDEVGEKENIPAEPFVPVTPAKNKINPMRTVHTVSKVPLRPEGEVSPLKASRKRGRSLGNTSPVRFSTRLRKSIDQPNDHNVHSQPPRKMPRLQKSEELSTSFGSEGVVPQQSKSVEMIPTLASPAKSPRKNIGTCSQVLQGVVAHVDVHTTEGEDASGIFIELLQQMGARCVRHWAWNPRSSLSPVEGADPKDGKVGITHIVFKDGGIRTLEKVRQASGLVKCVGVSWVLDCERESKWLDEMAYTVDSTIIPRGGAKRRKSMQPRTLSNVNGTLVKAEQLAVSASGRRSGADWGAMEDFMRLSPPVPSRNEPGTPEKSSRPTDSNKDYCQTPRTPGLSFNFDDIGMSPATPFFLQKANIVQQTCPPKQTRQGLFSTSPSVDDELSSQRLKFKLEAARRKSHAFKPRVKSPLAR